MRWDAGGVCVYGGGGGGWYKYMGQELNKLAKVMPKSYQFIKSCKK